MANEGHLEILKQGVEAWNEWREKDSKIRPDLSRTNIIGMNLIRANFINVNFIEANFDWRANLSESNLVLSTLKRANLRGVYLNSANLSRADLTMADLTGADLREANLSEATLRKTNLVGADLTGANFTGANLTEVNLNKAKLPAAHFTWQVNLNKANLSDAKLTGAALIGARLTEANLSGAKLCKASLLSADLTMADLSSADLRGADLTNANLSRANLAMANLSGAYLDNWNEISDDSVRLIEFVKQKLGYKNNWLKKIEKIDDGRAISVSMDNSSLLLKLDTDKNRLIEEFTYRNFYIEKEFIVEIENNNLNIYRNADLSRTNLTGANLKGVNFTWANLSEANLTNAQLIETNFEKANLTGCRIYGISAWGLEGEPQNQLNLIITPVGEPDITVDDLEVAQFIYLMINNKKIRKAIDTITSKVVLILGRFDISERKAVLDALREKLRNHKNSYLPVVFDFEKPHNRDITETVRTLAHLARFIIADITEPRSIPQELQAVIPDLKVPVQPLLLEGSTGEYTMFKDLKKKYHWVLAVYPYKGLSHLLASLEENVIAPAEMKLTEIKSDA